LRKALIATIFVLAFSFIAAAQSTPKAEVFGGYQYTNADLALPDRASLNGWNAQLSGYFNRNLGITADFSGIYGSPDSGFGPFVGSVDTTAYSYMFGPVLRAPMGKATPYVHALFGATHIEADNVTLGNFTDTAFSYALGGGFDLNFHRRLALRLAQVDFYATRFGTGINGATETQNHVRVSTGLVFKF